MAISVKKFREIVFQLLYSRDFEKSEKEAAALLVMRENKISKSCAREATLRADAIWMQCVELDQIITRKAHDYDLERIPKVELCVLRLGIYELLHTETPPKVVLSESVRIARKFATAEGAQFVNALLDSYYKERASATIPEKQAS